jgi:hypothetical protein
LTLLAPLFLAGLLAVGLPLWLHRLSAENPNRQRFTSLMFLEPGEPRRVLAKKLQYLLLLALRIAAIVLLALAFAQPAWLSSPSAADDKEAKLHVIVMDTSPSMGYADRWQRAERAAADILGDLASRDRAELVAAGRTAEIVTASTEDRGAVRQGLDAMKPGVFHVDYGRLMRSLDGVLRGADRPVVLHIVTDAQKTALPTRFAELAPQRPAEVEIHSVAETETANWSVESFAGSPATGALEAYVRSFAPERATKTLALELNGQRVAERTVDVDPGQRVQVTFDPLELKAGGNRVVALLTPADELPADDRRFVALKRPEPRSVLIVSGAGGGVQAGRDELFVDSALKTLKTLSLETRTVAPGKLGDEKLGDASFVVVPDVGALPAAETAQLQDYVQSGGALLVALGQRSNGLTTIPITGEQVRSGGSLRRGGSFVSVGSADLTHPALRGLGELRSAKFFRYVDVAPAADDRVLVELDTGSPLLIERRLGAGRVLLFTSTLDRAWNDLPIEPVFVPFVAGLANHLLGTAGFSSEADLGTTLSVRTLGIGAGQIFDPRGEKALGLGGGTDDVMLDQVGFYEAVGGGRSELVAVNLDPAESDLASADQATLDRWQGLGFEAREVAERSAGTEAAASRVPRSLGPWLLAVLAAVLIMESWVGNWHLRVRRGLAS